MGEGSVYLVMMAVFNRFDARLEEAARDMGASEWLVFKEITLPLILPGIVAAGLVGFTLSYDEFARTTLLSGEFIGKKLGSPIGGIFAGAAAGGTIGILLVYVGSKFVPVVLS